MLACKHKDGKILHGAVVNGKAVIKFKCSSCGRVLTKQTSKDNIYDAKFLRSSAS